MLNWSRVFSLALLFIAQPSEAATSDDSAECTKTNSFRVDVLDVFVQQRSLIGECVGVAGLRAGNVIVANQRDLYRFTRGDQSVERRAVGLAARGWQFDDPIEWGIYYGRLVNCRSDRTSYFSRLKKQARASKTRSEISYTQETPLDGADEDDAIVINEGYGGYCRDYDGSAIFFGSYEKTKPATFNRLTGDGNRRHLGDLVSVPGKFSLKANVDWLTHIALRSPCDTSLRINNPPIHIDRVKPALRQPYADDGWARQMKRLCPSGPAQFTTFLVSPRSIVAERSAKFDAVVCVCTEADCKSRWPIALIDTNRAKQRPYICERMLLKPREWYYDDEGNEVVNEYEYSLEDDSLSGSWWGEIEFTEPE